MYIQISCWEGRNYYLNIPAKAGAFATKSIDHVEILTMAKLVYLRQSEETCVFYLI